MQRNIYLIILFFGFQINLFSQVLIPGDLQNDIFKLITLENDFEDKPIVINPSILTYYDIDSMSFLGWERLIFNTKQVGDRSFRVINPSASMSYNSEYARGLNDGAVWLGRGLNSSMNFGFTGRKGKFHYSFAPVVYYAQNKPYRIDSGPFDKNEFQYPFNRGIDWVLRYGDNAFVDFWWGQSEVRFIEKNFTVGLSTQNFIWGPSQINPLLMSNNAPGIPHIDIGTATPFRTKSGDWEFKVYWGVMQESDYFDEESDNDLRYLNAWTVGYRPSFMEGLSVGMTRIKYRDMPDGGRLGFKDLFTSFSTEVLEDPDPIVPGGQNDVYDQMAAFTMRWAFPDKGFEFYIEYALNDFPGNLAGLLELPDRSRAYNLGFIKVKDLKNGAKLLLNYEHTTLANNQTQINNITPTYYAHSVVKQGYTNNGQIMGAADGPGANADLLRVNYYINSHIVGFSYHRTRHNDDYLVKNFPFGDPPHDWENSFDLSYSRQWNNMFVDAHMNVTTRRNWYFDTDVFTFYNIQPSVRLTYILP
ncbi:MAG: capsule assembly Wzi family protein [Ekhidna sp.]|uniref:capsule assembly Wzi family protein n=1 Tax=Ekhidna sp. TaxID=2608089 RepID=UPI0032ED40A9